MCWWRFIVPLIFVLFVSLYLCVCVWSVGVSVLHLPELLTCNSVRDVWPVPPRARTSTCEAPPPLSCQTRPCSVNQTQTAGLWRSGLSEAEADEGGWTEADSTHSSKSPWKIWIFSNCVSSVCQCLCFLYVFQDGEKKGVSPEEVYTSMLVTKDRSLMPFKWLKTELPLLLDHIRSLVAASSLQSDKTVIKSSVSVRTSGY